MITQHALYIEQPRGWPAIELWTDTTNLRTEICIAICAAHIICAKREMFFSLPDRRDCRALQGINASEYFAEVCTLFCNCFKVNSYYLIKQLEAGDLLSFYWMRVIEVEKVRK